MRLLRLIYFFQLIQRLYDLENGSIELENPNIESLNLPFVRSKLGIVSQEPVLFDRTIAENIQYGDNERIVSMEEVSLWNIEFNLYTTFINAGY